MVLTRHAQQRMDEMGLGPIDIEGILDNPEVDYPAHSRYGEGARTAQRGQIAVGYKLDAGQRIVTTVLIRTQEQYAR